MPINIALLTEGGPLTASRDYKHLPPDGGKWVSRLTAVLLFLLFFNRLVQIQQIELALFITR